MDRFYVFDPKTNLFLYKQRIERNFKARRQNIAACTLYF